MERIYLFLLYNVGCMLFFYQLDYALRYMKAKNEWFHLRIIGNGLIAATTVQDVYMCLCNHNVSSLAPQYQLSEALVFSLYLYQSIIFKPKREDFWYHTLVMIRTPVCYLNNNKTASVIYFFCNGYPSFIDYTTLVLMKNNLIEPQTQKYVSSFTNAYLRKPGAAFAASLLLQHAIQFHYVNQRYFYMNAALSLMIYKKYAVSPIKLIKSK
tara:strand:- start:39 stop:671 length:633 start_codon:yes stop_codon:yes gene_type:complete